jgi:type IV pilus assembly protein PilZ
MSGEKPEERRESPRVSIELSVEERTGEALYFQRATNLSLGGVYLDGTLPHPPGTRVALALRLPGRETPMRVLGEVVAREPSEIGMAIRFVDLDAEGLAELERVLAIDA